MILLLSLALAETVAEAFPPPPGASRLPADAFGEYLLDLPLYPPDRQVLDYRGNPMAMPAARVVNLPVPAKDLQQCADSLLRLRATFLRNLGQTPAFHYTSGDLSSWGEWAVGTRLKVSGNSVRKVTHAAVADNSDASFERWLLDLYTYAGTRSLPLDTLPDTHPDPGDIVVQPGSPGHAVILLDVASDGQRTYVLAGQGYMPAMDFHVVAGPLSGWYEVSGTMLPTAPLPVPWSGLRHWK